MYTEDALYFDSPFLSSRTPGVISDDPVVDQAVKEWMAGKSKAISFKSPMGTGKTTLLDTLLRHPLLPHARVLVITYRRTLALEQYNKLGELGFENYMKVTDKPLHKVDKLICQIESLHRVTQAGGILPDYDVVIMDEIELVLQHFCSPTVKSPAATMALVVNLLGKCRRLCIAEIGPNVL